MAISLSFDVEEDIHTGKFKGITVGIPRLMSILDKRNIKATLFVPAKIIKKFSSYFKLLRAKGHEISLHGYEHERFDDLSFDEKEKRIKKSVKIYMETFNESPKGFRAPQHSIDEDTLDLLQKYGFKYDASYIPLDFFQLIFFPKKFKLWAKNFLSRRRVYLIRERLYEVPTSSFFIPLVSLPIRSFPKSLLRLYFNVLKFFNKNLVFEAHSWDFIDVRGKIANIWPKESFLNGFKFMISINKNNKFMRMEDLVND